jgi:hypothetical protein
LKSALARGETLEQAMLTFLNAGYPQSDIEEAKMALQSEDQNKIDSTKIVEQKKEEKPVEKPKTEQKVSDYKEKKKSKTGLIIVLIIILVLLLGVLASMFLFKEKVLEILGSIFD